MHAGHICVLRQHDEPSLIRWRYALRFITHSDVLLVEIRAVDTLSASDAKNEQGAQDTHLLKYDSAAYVRRQASSLKRKRRSSSGLSHVSLQDLTSATIASGNASGNAPYVRRPWSTVGLGLLDSHSKDVYEVDSESEGPPRSR